MTVSVYQFSFNGLTIGAGTNYVVENIDGLGGTSPLRIQDDNRGYIDGSYSGRDFYDGRTVTFDILVLGDSSYSAQYYYNNYNQPLLRRLLAIMLTQQVQHLHLANYNYFNFN